MAVNPNPPRTLPPPLLGPPPTIPGQRPVPQPPTGQVGSQPVRAPRFAPTAYGPVALPNDWTDEQVAGYVQAWQEHIRRLDQALQATAGFEREQLQAQREDAQKALDNAYRIAQLQSETSRYGTDVQRQTELAKLKENARQFDQTHALDTARLGLDRAKTATDFLSSADRWAQAGNFLDLSGRVLSGQSGVGTYGRAVQPRANTMQDFAVLEGGGNPYANRGSAVGAGQGGSGSDARVKAITDILKANPPSDGLGTDDNDYAVLKASEAIMNLNLNPRQQASINSNPEYSAILGSNLRRLGQNAESWMARQRQSGVGQQGVRVA